MPRDRLFRQQAIDARSTQWLGAIRIARPIGDGVVAAFGLVVVAGVVAFGFFGTYTRRATVPGLLEPVGGVLRLTTPSAGTVLARPVVEGQGVSNGDVLFVLSTERRSNDGATQATIADQLDARRASLERDLALGGARHASRVRATQERLAAIDLESQRLVEETEINAARRRIAEANVERFAVLARTGFVAPAAAQARVDEALVLDAQRAALRRNAASLARERGGLAAQIDESRLQVEGELTGIRRSLASLGQERAENEARRSAVVTAPSDARVTGLAARVGQSIAAGGLLATLVPEHVPLEANLYASSRQAGFVARGQRVRLRYAAYPYQKFGVGEGVVDSIERSPYAPQELPAHVLAALGMPTLQGAEPVYRIVVTIDSQTIPTYGRDQPLRSGMLLEADVIQDRRRLFEWLFEPVYGIAGRS